MRANLKQIPQQGVPDGEHVYHSQGKRRNLHTASLNNVISYLMVAVYGLRKLGPDVNVVCLHGKIGVLCALCLAAKQACVDEQFPFLETQSGRKKF